MFRKVSILMAYKPDHGPRDKLLKWVKRFYKSVMPGVEICIGVPSGTLFNRSRGMNLAAKKATRDVFVIADGDIIFNPADILKAIKLLSKYPWVIPFSHKKVFNLSRRNTEEILKSEPQWPLRVPVKNDKVDRRFGKNFAGRLLVITRKNFQRMGGFDERFTGYGCEDTAFAWAANTICGYRIRLNRKLYHMWHPPANGHHPFRRHNHRLLALYTAAKGNKAAMYQLIRSRRQS